MVTVTSLGQVSVPEMRRYGYSDRLATGAMAAGGTIGALIPPSIILVIYGVLTETSITDLFIAALLPGLMELVIYILAIAAIVRIWPGSAEPGQSTSFAEKLSALPKALSMLTMFAVVIGGLYLGIFTPTEAAGIGVLTAFVIGLARRSLGWPELLQAITGTLRTIGMIALIVTGAFMLISFFVLTRANTTIADWVSGIAAPAYVILLIILLIYLILGCFLGV